MGISENATEAVEQLLEAGLNALDSGDYDTALSHWNEVLTLEPDNGRAARLVEELGRLIRDGRAANMTPASGEFVVVVDDEDLIEIDEQETASPGLISRHALARLRQVIDEQAAEQRALNDALAVAQNQTAAREQELADTLGRLSSLQSDLAEATAARNDLRVMARLRDQQAADFDQRLTERKAYERELLEKVRRLEAAEEEGSAEIERLTTALEALTAEHAQATTDLAARVEAAATLTADLDAARAAQSEAEAQVETLQADLATVRGDLDAQTSEVQRLESELVAASEAVTHAAEARETLEGQLGEALDAAEAATARVAELEKALAESEQRVIERQEELEAASSALDEAELARAGLRSELAQTVREMEEIRENTAGEVDAAAASEAARDQLEGALEEARAALAETRGALEARNEAWEEAQEELAAAAAAAAAGTQAAAELEEARATLAAQEERLAELEAALEAAAPGSRVLELEAQLAAAEGRAETAEEQLQELKTPSSIAPPIRPSMRTPLENRAVTGAFEEVPAELFASAEPPHDLTDERLDTPSATTPVEGVEELDDGLLELDDGLFGAELLESDARELDESASFDEVPEAPTPPRERGVFDSKPITAVDTSAFSRLKDVQLSFEERISWIIDEYPTLATTDIAAGQEISSQAAFVLQTIDGSMTFNDIMDVVGLPRNESSEILVDLVLKGIVTSPSLDV